ncbi:MAG: DNA repair protein RecN [Actinobacteria bacterium]|jgi:DNA repair protein RecN (Recombination protein N)|nr:DNA repair protein RecN [Actinomycetota bacterium]
MLAELRVRSLGVLDDVSIRMREGMTAITGETGAGKTLVIEAMGLLCGSRADASMVRHGADEAVIEGRFVDRDGEEVIISRQVGSNGRSRAWINGRMAPVASLGEVTASLVDIYSQHSHHSLLSPSTQRDILDMSGGIDLSGLIEARRKLRGIEEEIGTIEGGTVPVHREIELIRRQVDELDRASIDAPEEYQLLGEEEERLAGAEQYHEAFSTVASCLEGDRELAGGIIELFGSALVAVRGLSGCSNIISRLEAQQAEAQDLLLEVHDELSNLVFDPARLEEIRVRKLTLKELIRRYSDDGSLESVIEKRETLRQSLEDLHGRSLRLVDLERQRGQAANEVRQWETRIREERSACAVEFASRVADDLERLGMGKAIFTVEVAGSGTGEPVEFKIGVNPGEMVLPVAKVASGGELARTMLAIRLAMRRALSSEAGNGDSVPVTMVFDEVDAGIGGEAGLSVGRALYELSEGRQVIVVTHLPQVAAFADHQVRVTKKTSHSRTYSEWVEVSGEDRVEEIARMLSGQPNLQAAMDHAGELLAMVNNPGVHQMQRILR